MADDPTLLVIDHDEDVVRVVAAAADSFGFRVVSEGRTRSAFAMLADLKPDAALVDLTDIDARTVLHEIGAVDPQCPVILMTRDWGRDAVRRFRNPADRREHLQLETVHWVEALTKAHKPSALA